MVNDFMKKSNFYSECLADLKRVLNGSTMEVSSNDGNVVITSKDGVNDKCIDIILTFDDDKVEIEGCTDGCSVSNKSIQNFGNPESLYDDFDDLYESIKECIVTVYGEINAEIMSGMFN